MIWKYRENYLFLLRNKTIIRKGAIMKRMTVMFVTLIAIGISSAQLTQREGLYYDGNELSNGEYVEYYDNGAKKAEMNIEEGKLNGRMLMYHSNGELAEVRYYANNKMDGSWVKYDEKRNKIAEAHYKNGKKDGKWAIYDETGNKKYIINYEDGKRVGAWSYNEAEKVNVAEK